MFTLVGGAGWRHHRIAVVVWNAFLSVLVPQRSSEVGTFLSFCSKKVSGFATIDGRDYTDAHARNPEGSGNPAWFIFLSILLLSFRGENHTNSDSVFVYNVVCSVREIGVPTSEERQKTRTGVC